MNIVRPVPVQMTDLKTENSLTETAKLKVIKYPWEQLKLCKRSSDVQPL